MSFLKTIDTHSIVHLGDCLSLMWPVERLYVVASILDKVVGVRSGATRTLCCWLLSVSRTAGAKFEINFCSDEKRWSTFGHCVHSWQKSVVTAYMNSKCVWLCISKVVRLSMKLWEVSEGQGWAEEKDCPLTYGLKKQATVQSDTKLQTDAVSKAHRSPCCHAIGQASSTF